MKKSSKRIVGWGTGVAVGIVFVLLTFVLVIGVNSGSMMSLNGQKISFNSDDDVSQIAPAAGGDEAAENRGCGADYGMIGQKANERALKQSGQPYRILPPNSMMTMDHNPARLNVHVNDAGIIEDVRCG